MAKVKRYVGDHVSGKMGNAVFFQLNGQTYSRMAPQFKKESWNEEQQLHRQRFKKAVNFWRMAKEAKISDIWNLGSDKMNSYALFMKANLPAFALDGSVIDPKMFQLSTGKLYLPQALRAQSVENGIKTVEVEWKNDTLLRGERLNDELMAIITNGRNYLEKMPTGIKRGDMKGSFAVPEKESIHMMDFTHVYLCFASKDRKNYTASSCFEI